METISNIATNKDQSERLKQCGVDPKTADMCLSTRTRRIDGTPIAKKRQTTNLWIGYPCRRTTSGDEELENLPAWSLSALLAILPEKIKGGYWLTIQKCRTGEDAPVYYCIAYFKCKWDTPQGYFQLHDTHIESIGIFYRPQPY